MRALLCLEHCVVSKISFLPKRCRGHQSDAAIRKYQREVDKFCDLVLQIQSTLDFAVGSREYCYLLESHGLRKGDFDAAQKLINDCRKSGQLPLDICCEDSGRATVGLEKIDSNSVEEEVETWAYTIEHAHEDYTPFSFWDDQEVYVEVGVEKLALRNLFAPVCWEEFRVAATNLRGWSDLNSRGKMMRRFKQHEAAGRKCVLLLCNDHDPGGLLISNKMRKNLEDLSRAVEWSPDNLVIIRFGLNDDFIDRHGLTWIDNLETSSGEQLDDPDHGDHYKRHVQDYIAQFGVRKCEASALVAQPEVGRQLVRDALLQHIPADAVQRYERKLKRVRERLRRALEGRVS
jgi:hypothetical protein